MRACVCVHSYYRLIRNAINYNSTIPKFRTGHLRYDAKNKEIEIAALTGVLCAECVCAIRLNHDRF